MGDEEDFNPNEKADGNKTPEKGLGDAGLDLCEKANIFELDEEQLKLKLKIEQIDKIILQKYETVQRVG